MNETQSIRHDAPLKQGEIRTHTVGAQTFRVMHVAGGSFTQVAARNVGENTRVLCTDRFESAAVRAYADAIAQAESDRIDALDDADGVAFIGASSGKLVEPTSSPAESTDNAGELAMVVYGRHNDMEAAKLHLAALAPWPGDSLRELVEAYGEAMTRAGINLAMGSLDRAVPFCTRADALKAEIVKRYGAA